MTPKDWIVIILLVAVGSLSTPQLFTPSRTRATRNVKRAVLTTLLLAGLACGFMVHWAVSGR